MLMIENGFIYLAVLILIASTIVYTEKKTQAKIFEYLPAIVIIYFVVMLFSTFVHFIGSVYDKVNNVSSLTYFYNGRTY